MLILIIFLLSLIAIHILFSSIPFQLFFLVLSSFSLPPSTPFLRPLPVDPKPRVYDLLV